MPPSISEMLDSLEDVKDLYKQTFEQEVDSEELHAYSDGTSMKVSEQDGATFVVRRGSPPSLSELAASLGEVKGLYKQKFGADGDEPEVHMYSDGTSMKVVENDGCAFVVNRGAPPSISQLQESLDVVNGLYGKKFGKDVDA